MPLDTLKIAKQMEAAGMPRQQSEALAAVLQDEYFSQLVTNSDLGAAVDRLETKVESVEQRLEAKIVSFEQRLEAKVEASVNSLRNDTRVGHAELGGRIGALEARLTMMQWAIGLVLAGVVALLIKSLR